MTENPQTNKKNVFDRFFRLSERGTNIKTEIFAGLLMFFEAVVMLVVASQLLANAAGMSSYTTIYYGVVLTSIITTLLVGFLCNAPFVQSISMSGVVLIATLLTKNAGVSLANVALIAFFANVVYLVIMVIRPAREFLFASVPQQVKKALPAALGGYLLVYAVTQLNLFGTETHNFSSVLEGMAAAGDALPFWGINVYSFGIDNAAFGGWYATMAVITALVAIVALVVFNGLKLKHSTILGFATAFVFYLAMWVLRGNFVDYYLYAFITPAYGGMYFYDSLPRIQREFDAAVFAQLFESGFDFSAFKTALESAALAEGAEAAGTSSQVWEFVISTFFSFLLLGVAETGSVVNAHAYAANAYDEEGNIVFVNNKLLGPVADCANVYAVNALSSLIGCFVGIGPVNPRAEGIVGANEGGKTGLSAIVAGLLMIVALFNLVFSALFLDGIIVLGMLIFAAVSLLSAFKHCDFTDLNSALPFIGTVLVTALMQNIGYGILVGILLDTVTKLLGGRFRQVHIGSYVLSALTVVLLVIKIV